MPPESTSTTAWTGPFYRKAAFQLPSSVRRALLRPGSLSSRLQAWCEGPLPVTVVNQGAALPTRDEARLLNLRPREQVWVREVRLGPVDNPWVKARTVAPLREMQGASQHLRNLGSRPLGSVLFHGRGWERSPFLLGMIGQKDKDGRLPARRSLFFNRSCRLLVTEGFFPAYWLRLDQAQRRTVAESGSRHL